MLKDYAKGVFECLSWLEGRMTEFDGRPDRWETLRGEVDDAVQDIRRCVGVDFRERLRSII